MNTLVNVLLLGAIHTSIVALAVLLARLCLRRSAAGARALVGAMGMACILAVTGAAALPLHGIRVILNAPHSIETSPPVADAASNRLDAVPPATERPLARAERLTETAVQLPLALLTRLGSGVQQATTVADASPRGWKWLLVAICAIGGGIGTGRLILSLLALKQLRRASTPVLDEPAAQLLQGLCERAGYRRAIEIRQTDQLASAAAFGWRRPVILFPSDWRAWSGDELSAVLAHEVAHIVRGDYLQRLAALSAVAVHFYHPLVRFVAWRLAMDQEFAADRLARRIAPCTSAYGKGLARLALRYHDSFKERRVWPNVSVMPRSKDFLARRLEMLRTKNDSTEPRSARWASYGLCAALVTVACVAVFIRGATADDQPPPLPARPIETARLPEDKRTDGTRASAPAVDAELFSRAAFDPAMLRANKGGGFLIRVGDLLRHPEIQPHVDAINAGLVELLHDIIGEAAEGFDVREIEWMAGDLRLSVTATDAEGEHGRIMFGSGGMVIRTKHAQDWQANMLKEMPGTSLKTFEGKSYVQLPSLPALGPAPMKMRAPNDRTIIYAIGTKGDEADAEAEAKFLRKFFDDAPQPCPWADAWRAVDGGLVTFVIDNHLTGWQQVVGWEKEYPEFALPLFNKSKFIGFGSDWTNKSNRMGMRMQVTCDDQQSVQDIHLAAMTLLSYWPAAFLQAGDGTAAYHKRILQFFSSVRVQPSAADAGEHYVHMTADVGWEKQEFVEVLRQTWDYMSDLPPEPPSSD